MNKGDQTAGPKTRGFTIVETMIVLAVTSVLFVAIAATLSGRQNESEFGQAIRSVQAQIQQVVNQVSAGFYPNDNSFSCTQSGPNQLSIVSGSNNQGTNQDCVFLGKVIQFDVQGTDPEEYNVYTVAGLRSTPSSTSPSDFAAANPTVGFFSYVTGSLKYGMTTYPLISPNTIGNSMGAVGFLMELGNLSSTSISGYVSGAQQVDLVPIPNTFTGMTAASAISAINSSLNSQSPPVPVNPSTGVQVCFVSGGTNQSGLITIGGSGRQLLVKLDIKADRTCT